MKVVYIPLDERPCNYNFASRIATDSGVSLIRPDREVLGNKKEPANYELLESFMLDHAAEADSYIVSLDMLLYGGIVPSRLHHLGEDELTDRLQVLERIKEINPGVKIYAFALIMRCPKYSSSDEEPDYYEFCGREIFLTGQVKHKLELGLIDKAEGEKLLEEYASVIAGNLADFEARRKINRNMLIKTVRMLHGAIDYLIIPQDDSAEFGYTSIDREAIKAELRANGLDDVAMYPGADEVGMTLLARAACQWVGKTPKIYFDFAHNNAPNITPLYEDRPLGKTLPFQVDSAGCEISTDREESDVILYLNYPAKDPVEVWQEKSEGYDMRDLESFCSRIKADTERGVVTAIADGAYCNGGDAELMKMLAERMDIMSISAYAGWNTSSNTLGTVICQAVFVLLFGDNDNQRKFLAERIYEDVGYCGKIRAHVTNNILPDFGFNYFDAGEESGVVADIVRRELETYIGENFPKVASRYRLAECKMPWKRMFEVSLSAKEV